MAQCEFCLNYNGIKCLDPNGVKYGEPIINPFEEIDRPAYLEKVLAGLFGLGGFF